MQTSSDFNNKIERTIESILMKYLPKEMTLEEFRKLRGEIVVCVLVEIMKL